MRITFLLVAAFSLLPPIRVKGQELSGAPSAADSGTTDYIRRRANRVGMNTDTLDAAPLRIRNDSAGSGLHVDDHIRHAAIGGFFGTLAGAAIGGGYGAWIDAHPADDAMFSATILLGIYGAIAGLAVGLITGAVWPVK
jgi:hypothetical protein